MLDRESILSASDITTEVVQVPEWGDSVRVRVITGRERDQFELASQGQARSNIRASLLVLALCNDAGERLFHDSDIDALGEKSASALDRLFDVAIRLNRIGDQGIEDEKKD